MNYQDLSDFLDLVKDPKKATALLDSLKKQQENIDASIATIGKVNEIDALKSKAEKALTKAALTLGDAEAQAEKMVDAARKAAAVILGNANDAQAKADAIKQEGLSAIDKATAHEKQLADRERKLAKDLDAYYKASADLAAKEADLADRVNKLRTAMV